jgi:hypothetical protein
MDDKEIQKRIKAGSILVQVSFEIIGNPKEHVETTLRGFINNLKNDAQITVLSEEFGEPEEVKDSNGLWSNYADTEMLVKTLDKLVWLCVNFMPASIEIIAPEELVFKEKDMTNWLNDLLAKLHEISFSLRQTNVKDEIVVQSMNAMIQNALLLATEHYHKPEEIEMKLGIEVKHLKPFFEALLKEDRIEKKGEEFYRKTGPKPAKQKGEKKHGAKKRS